MKRPTLSKFVQRLAGIAAIAGCQGAAAGLVGVPMTSKPGDWAAYVDIGTGLGGTFDIDYLGGITTFPYAFPPGNAGHPAVPGGYPTNMGAFVDPATGQLGVLGSNAFTGVTSGYAVFEMNFQFSNSGMFSTTVHFEGTVSAAAPNQPIDPNFSYLREYVQLQDLNGGGQQTAGYSICSSLVWDCASAQPSISTDFTVTMNVTAGHTYQLLVNESGTAIGAAAFDGIDPSSISLALSPGLRVDTSNGIAPPAFLAATITPVPEPSTFALFGIGLGLAGWKLRRRAAAA